MWMSSSCVAALMTAILVVVQCLPEEETMQQLDGYNAMGLCTGKSVGEPVALPDAECRQSEYLLCYEGKATYLMRCPDRFLFNKAQHWCDWQRPDDAPYGVSILPQCVVNTPAPAPVYSCSNAGVDPFARLAQPTTCQNYTQCVHKTPYSMQCPVGFYFISDYSGGLCQYNKAYLDGPELQGEFDRCRTLDPWPQA